MWIFAGLNSTEGWNLTLQVGFLKKIKKILKIVLTFRGTHGILYFVAGENTSEDTKESTYGVWLSLARAPGLGPGGRRFESCHPDMRV